VYPTQSFPACAERWLASALWPGPVDERVSSAALVVVPESGPVRRLTSVRPIYEMRTPGVRFGLDHNLSGWAVWGVVDAFF